MTASADRDQRERNDERDDERDEGEPELSDERMYSTVPLETDDGEVVIQQQNVGKDNEIGGGEWPDPDTPPQAPAPGAA